MGRGSLGAEASVSAAEGDIFGWLRRGEWPRLQAHFAIHAPQSAGEHAARALLIARLPPTAERAAQIVADWRRACELQPAHLLHHVNLAQALLDAGDAGGALELATTLVERAPASYPAAEKHCLALCALARWDDAERAAAHASHLAQVNGTVPSANVAALHAELASRWWQPLSLGGATLRPPHGADAPFVRASFGDSAFMRAFHRYQGADAASVRDFIAQGQRPPRQSRRRDWLVLDRAGRPAGFAGIVDIDCGNRRGELLVGILGDANREALAPKAALAAIAFAFERLGLEKLVSYVYGDNASAQANTLHLGFTQEGLLRQHVMDAHGRIDLYTNGLLREDFLANALLQRARTRWSAAAAPSSASIESSQPPAAP